MNYFEQVQAMHQQVLEFVEQQEPTCKVTSIDGYETTSYMPTMHSRAEITPYHAEFALYEIKLRFRVEARYLTSSKRLSCEVFATNDGKLRMGDGTISM